MPIANPRNPQVGETHTFQRVKGYKLVQERPFACRHQCACGECNGVWTTYSGPVVQVIQWMDNSTEVIVLCEDGERRGDTIVAPHGDACY